MRRHDCRGEEGNQIGQACHKHQCSEAAAGALKRKPETENSAAVGARLADRAFFWQPIVPILVRVCRTGLSIGPPVREFELKTMLFERELDFDDPRLTVWLAAK